MKRTNLPLSRFAAAISMVPLALVLTQACASYTDYKGDSLVMGFKPPPPPPPPVTASAPPPEPEKPKRVEVKGDKVEIHEKIQFDDGKATIRPASDGLLDEIAAAIKTIEPKRKVRVEGHSSAEGDKAKNQKLSEARSKSVVDALVKRGVPADQLVSKGFGSSQPIADNATEEGREANRRVDFIILGGKKDGADAAAAASAAPAGSDAAPKKGPPIKKKAAQ